MWRGNPCKKALLLVVTSEASSKLHARLIYRGAFSCFGLGKAGVPIEHVKPKIRAVPTEFLRKKTPSPSQDVSGTTYLNLDLEFLYTVQ